MFGMCVMSQDDNSFMFVNINPSEWGMILLGFKLLETPCCLQLWPLIYFLCILIEKEDMICCLDLLCFGRVVCGCFWSRI